MKIDINSATQARELFRQHRDRLAQDGISFPEAQTYTVPGWLKNRDLAMDAQPSLVTQANSAIPAILTTMIDPEVIRVLYAPLVAAEILGEKRKGNWLQDTVMFPVVEWVGEVSSYGDYSNNGMTNVNVNWPQRQNYIYQAIIKYGQREMERQGLAQIGWAAEQQKSAAFRLNQAGNNIYLFGVAGLQNYGFLNDPNLSAAISPAPKAAGGNSWFTSAGAPNATANEVYNDIVALVSTVIAQGGGTIGLDSPMTLVLSPGSSVALTFTNSFGVNVRALLKENFPNLKIITAPQYGVQSSSNPTGVVGGNYMQLIVTSVQGQDTGFAAFSEKLRAGPVVIGMSWYEQKFVQGSWGAVLQQPFAIASMLGI